MGWKLNLATKFTLLLLIAFVAGLIVSWIALYSVLSKQAEAEITTKGLLLIDTLSAVRDYTWREVYPRLIGRDNCGIGFSPQAIPAYAARRTFAALSGYPSYAGYTYKEASYNARNTADSADPFELTLLDQLISQPEIEELSGFYTRNGEQTFYIAHPLRVTSTACLDCHTSPETTPPEIVATYGSDYGYGWQMQEIIAAQVVHVPAAEVLRNASRSTLSVLAVFLSVSAATVILLNILLRRAVIAPVMQLSQLARRLGADELTAEEIESRSLTNVAARTDELGQLARTFQSMAREVYEREQQLKRQVQDLIIAIDERQRAQEVASISSTEYFQDLLRRARELREQEEGDDDT